jgi:hypothetical protein
VGFSFMCLRLVVEVLQAGYVCSAAADTSLASAQQLLALNKTFHRNRLQRMCRSSFQFCLCVL